MKSLIAVVLLAVSSLNASILYSNGSDTGLHAWAVNYGYAVTNSFTLERGAHISQVDFSVWDVNDLNNPLSAQWKITTEPFGGEVVASGGGNLDLISRCYVNLELFCQWEVGIYINADLPAGNYWLQIDGVATRWGTWAFWGQSNGVSQAYANDASIAHGASRTIPSEAFVVLGH